MERARIAQARASGAEVSLIAAPEVARALGRDGEGAQWALESQCDRVGPGARHGNSALAFEALRQAAGVDGFDEARFAAADSLGFIACAEARLGGPRVARKLVVEVDAADVSLAAPLPAGFSLDARIQREAGRWALRDADAVTGDEAARSALLAVGWQLAQRPDAASWEPGQEPRVTAVVTTYNFGKWLPAALDSVRAQTVPVEIVLVDDGSRPEDAAAVDAEVARDPSIRLIRQANQGSARARNAGVQAATTELVMIVDGDNLMRPRLIERLREALRLRPDAAWASPAFRMFDDESGSQTGVYGPLEGGGEALFLVNCGGDACALHRRDALLEAGGFSAPLGLIDDWDLWLSYAERGRTGVTVPEILFDYRQRTGSMLRSFTSWQQLRQRFELARRHPRLLGRNAEALVNLASSRLQEEFEEVRAPLLAEQAALQARLGAAAREAAELRARADPGAREASALRDALRSTEAALRREEEQSHAHREARRAAEHEEDAARAVAQAERVRTEAALEMAGKAREAARRAERESAADKQAAEQAREAEKAAREAQRELEAKLAALEAALDELAGSSAVRASKALHQVSPALHKAAGGVARALLAGLVRKA